MGDKLIRYITDYGDTKIVSEAKLVFHDKNWNYDLIKKQVAKVIDESKKLGMNLDATILFNSKTESVLIELVKKQSL